MALAIWLGVAGPFTAWGQAPGGPGPSLPADLPAGATPGGALPRLPPITPAPPSDDGPFPVPPVVERPLEVGAGERVFVSGFRLEGVGPTSPEGIVPGEIEVLLDRFRVEKQGLEGVRADGFLDEEVVEIAEFMRQVVRRRDLDMQFDGYQALVDRLRLAHLKRQAGLTIGQLQEAANRVTQYYRERGFILAQAFVPAQDVVDGLVTIRVFESRLGKVIPEGNERYDDALLAKPFAELLDAPVTAAGIESAILLASDYPGLGAFAVVQPGKAVGESDVVLRVREERRFEGSVRLDNEGTRFTGDNRVAANVSWNNPTGAGDRLTGTAVKQFSPRNGSLFGIEYVRPLWRPGFGLGAGFERNVFAVGAQFEGLGITGVTTTAEVFAHNVFVRSRQFNVNGELRLRRTQSISKFDGVVVSQDDLAMLDARVRFDHIDGRAQAINQGMLGGVVGLGSALGAMTNSASNPPASRVSGSDGRLATNHFSKVVANFSRLKTLSPRQTLLFRAEGQFSRSLLGSTEQFQIGGPANLRAYPVSEFQVDSGLFASAEWTLAAPFIADRPAFRDLTWGQVLRVSFFTDFVWGDLNEPTQTDIDDNAANFLLGGYGVGMHLDIPGGLNARLQAAHPFGTRKGSDGDSVQYWFDLNYTF